MDAYLENFIVNLEYFVSEQIHFSILLIVVTASSLAAIHLQYFDYLYFTNFIHFKYLD